MQSMQKIFQTCACIFTFHKGTVHNSLQKAGLSSRCMIFSKKNVQDTAVFSGSTFLKFQLRFHAQSVLIPCKCATFFPTSLCGVLVFRLDPAALLRPPPRRTHHYSSLTHSSLTHSLTHSLLTHSLTLSLTHSLIHSTHSLTHGGAAEPLWRSCGARGAPLARGSLSCGRCNTESFLAAFRVAGAVHRASWRSCGARGRRWAAAAFLVAGTVHTASWLRFAWQAQYTEPPGRAAARVAAAGPRLPFSWQVQYSASWLLFASQAQCREPPRGAAARVAAAGPRLPFSWQAQYTELPGCASRGRRSTQSLLAELRRAWPPLGRGSLSRGRRSTQSFLAAFRVAGALHTASWRSCGARGRRWAVRLPFSWQAQYTELPGCVSRGRRSTQSLLAELRRAWPPLGRGCLSPWQVQYTELPGLRFAWQAQYTEPPGGAAACVAATGPRLPFSWHTGASWLRFAWQAQYTEPPGGAAAPRVAAAGPRLPFSWQVQYTELPGCVSRGRRSTQSLLAELRRQWPQLGPRLLSRGRRHLSFTPHHAPLITSHSSLLTYHSHSSLTT